MNTLDIIKQIAFYQKGREIMLGETVFKPIEAMCCYMDYKNSDHDEINDNEIKNIVFYLKTTKLNLSIVHTYDGILMEIIDKIRLAGKQHYELFPINTNIDLKNTLKDDCILNYLQTFIIQASSYVFRNSKRGSAKYIIIPEDIYNTYFKQYIIHPKNIITQEENSILYFAGYFQQLSVYVSPLVNNEILLGRIQENYGNNEYSIAESGIIYFEQPSYDGKTIYGTVYLDENHGIFNYYRIPLNINL